jgi:uncharacterized coiled-coil protein SlyX
MSYPILKAKDGNEFYNNFLGSIEKFTTKYIAPQLFGKKLVLYEGNKKRMLTQKEIETYVKIYLLPKLYLFYSRINYTFTLNIKGYYEYYYDSLNNFNNLCRFYLNKENPVVRKINFDIHTKMKKEQKNVNSNTSFYDVIIKNNEEIIGILEIFSNILDKLVNKNKAIRQKYNNIMKMITDLQADYVLLLGKDIIEDNRVNKKDDNPKFLDKINKMITNLGEIPIFVPSIIPPSSASSSSSSLGGPPVSGPPVSVPPNQITEGKYTELNNKIKLYKTKYLDFLKKYQSLLLTLKTLDINITGFNLDEVIDFTSKSNKDINVQIKTIFVKSFNLEQIYGLFRKDILDKIKKIKEKNTNIQLLKSIKKNNSTYEKILEKITKTDDIFFLKEIPENKLITTANETKRGDKLDFSYTDYNIVDYEIKDDDFFKLLFYSLAYIRNNMIKKFNFFNSTNPTPTIKPVDELVILDKGSNNSTFLVLKKSIEKFQKTLEENEDNINEEIKNTNDTKDDLKADLDSFDTKKYAEQIKDINDKIAEKKEEIKKLAKEISALQAELKPLQSSLLKKTTPSNKDEVQQQIELLDRELKIKENEKNKTIPDEIVILENEKKKFSLLTFKEETNIELINKKIKLQDELLTKYETLKKSNPFEKFKSEDFIIFDESLKKFRKNIDKVTQKTSTSSPILSYFKQNYLYYSLFFDKNRTTLKIPVTIDLKALLTLKLFFSKSKPQIIKNDNKEKNPQINEDFMSEIFKFIDNETFIDFLKNYDKKFKDTITKLLKENRKDTKFNQLASTIDTEKNKTTLVKIITSCIEDESKYTNKTKIYPYTNFIIAYFALYLIIINLILENLIKK